MKAPFNPLFADRTLLTTVAIKVWCPSEMDARRSKPVSMSDAPRSLETAAGVWHSCEGTRLLASRIVSGYKPDGSGTPVLIPEPRVTEAPPSGNTCFASCTTWCLGGARRDDTSVSSPLLGDMAGGRVSLSIIFGRRSPEEEDD